MNEYPLISVIVPAYNAARWLEECVASVEAQTYPTWELVLVDDGSTDATWQIAMRLAEKNARVKPIHTENGGVCRARNKGIDNANGEFIAFLDADDALMPQALDVLYSALVNTNSDIAIGWKTNVSMRDEDLGCPYNRESCVLTGTEGLEYSLKDYPAMYAVWGKLYRKHAVEDVRFVEGRRVHEDSFYLFQCLLKQPKVVICEDIVLRYRISDNSASRASFSDKFFDILYFADEKYRAIEQEYPELIELAKNMIVKANMALLQLLCKTTDKKYIQAEKQCIKQIRRYRKSFHSATPFDRKWFLVIVCGLYCVYKWIRKR